MGLVLPLLQNIHGILYSMKKLSLPFLHFPGYLFHHKYEMVSGMSL